MLELLKNHQNSTYQVMLLQDTIGEHLLEVDNQDMALSICKRMVIISKKRRYIFSKKRF